MFEFRQLWDNHPNNSGESVPCKNLDGKPAFENQCAIRMGICLHKAGLSLLSFKGERCWHNHNPPHVLRAEELAKWLKSELTFAQFKKFSGKNAYKDAVDHITLKKGIVFYKDFWGPGMQADHIDLWNRLYATKELSTFFGVLFPSLASYNKAKEVWFWEIST